MSKNLNENQQDLNDTIELDNTESNGESSVHDNNNNPGQEEHPEAPQIEHNLVEQSTLQGNISAINSRPESSSNLTTLLAISNNLIMVQPDISAVRNQVYFWKSKAWQQREPLETLLPTFIASLRPSDRANFELLIRGIVGSFEIDSRNGHVLLSNDEAKLADLCRFLLMTGMMSLPFARWPSKSQGRSSSVGGPARRRPPNKPFENPHNYNLKQQSIEYFLANFRNNQLDKGLTNITLVKQPKTYYESDCEIIDDSPDVQTRQQSAALSSQSNKNPVIPARVIPYKKKITTKTIQIKHKETVKDPAATAEASCHHPSDAAKKVVSETENISNNQSLCPEKQSTQNVHLQGEKSDQLPTTQATPHTPLSINTKEQSPIAAIRDRDTVKDPTPKAEASCHNPLDQTKKVVSETENISSNQSLGPETQSTQNVPLREENYDQLTTIQATPHTTVPKNSKEQTPNDAIKIPPASISLVEDLSNDSGNALQCDIDVITCSSSGNESTSSSQSDNDVNSSKRLLDKADQPLKNQEGDIIENVPIQAATSSSTLVRAKKLTKLMSKRDRSSENSSDEDGVCMPSRETMKRPKISSSSIPYTCKLETNEALNVSPTLVLGKKPNDETSEESNDSWIPEITSTTDDDDSDDTSQVDIVK